MEEYSEEPSGRFLPAFSDDLLTPTLEDGGPGSGKSPYRLQSQIWIALLGGTIAMAGIASVNGRRLGLSKTKQIQILVVGVVSLALVLGVVVVFSQIEVDELWQPGENGFRFITRAIALIAYLVYYQLQKSGNRIYTYFRGSEFESLWRDGLAAIILLGALQNFLITFLADFIVAGE